MRSEARFHIVRFETRMAARTLSTTGEIVPSIPSLKWLRNPSPSSNTAVADSTSESPAKAAKRPLTKAASGEAAIRDAEHHIVRRKVGDAAFGRVYEKRRSDDLPREAADDADGGAPVVEIPFLFHDPKLLADDLPVFREPRHRDPSIAVRRSEAGEKIKLVPHLRHSLEGRGERERRKAVAGAGHMAPLSRSSGVRPFGE